MARKKKVKENKEIKTVINNSAATGGNVKITVLKNNKKVNEIVKHNTGTIHMCEYLASALIGDYVIAKRPGVIVPYTLVGANKVEIGNGSPYVSSKLGVKASDWDNYVDIQGNQVDGGFCTSTITFLIPGSIVSGSTINGFILKSNDTSRKPYAEVQLDGEGLTITGDSNVRVVWTLYVSYKWDIDFTIRPEQ